MSSERRISNLPAAPSPLVGRTELLGVLEAGLRADGVGRRWVLTGPDGIGKSAVAAACVGRRAADFDVAWWVRAGDPLVLAEDMRVLADRLGITWLGSRVADQMRRELALWLQSNERWLLVFDDVVDPGALRDYLPSSERGIVLATAPAWPAPDRGADEDPALGFEALAVPPLSTTDGAALVLAAGSKGRGRRARRGTTDEERAAAERIALITRGTPLALRLAAHAGPLEAVPQALVDCLALIYEEGANVTEAEDAPEAIEIALEVAARHAESVGVAAVEATLCLFALMGGVAVPAEMAAAVEQLVGKVRARKALRVALRAGVVEQAADGSVSAPPTLRRIIRERIDEPLRARLSLAAQLALGEELARRRGQPDGALLRLAPTALAIVDATPSEPDPLLTGFLMMALRLLSAFTAEHGEAELGARLTGAALALIERGPADEEARVDSLCEHAIALGRLAEARSFRHDSEAVKNRMRAAFERTLEATAALYGADSVNVGSVLQRLGLFEKELRRYDEAITALTRARALAAAAPGTDVIDVVKCARAIGDCHDHKRRHAEAAQAFREAFALESSKPSPDAVILAVLQTSLGDALTAGGDFAGARAAWEQSVVLGLRSFEVMSRPAAFADFYQMGLRYRQVAEARERDGEDEAAIEAYRCALVVKTKCTWERDREIGHLYRAAGDLLRRRGEHAAAEADYVRAREAYVAARGERHPLVGVIDLRRGQLALERGDVDAAREHFARAETVVDREGNGDLELAALHAGMARLALLDGEPDVARERLTKAMENVDLEPHLEPRYVRSAAESVSALLEIGDALRAANDLARAYAVYEAALRAAEAALGDKHTLLSAIHARFRGTHTT